MAGIAGSYREKPVKSEEDEVVDDGKPVDVEIGGEEGASEVGPNGEKITDLGDDMLEIDFDPRDDDEEDPDDSEHDVNLADILPESVLSSLCDELMQGIEEDINSSSEWEQTIASAMEMLGLKISPGGIEQGEGTISKIHSTLMIEAIVTYQSEYGAEMLPAQGPVKVEDNDTEQGGMRSRAATALEQDMNHFLTDVAKEFYPEEYRKAFSQCFMGEAYKKIYHHPIKSRPYSEYVSALDMIVSNDITCLENANRKTHRIKMRQPVMLRMQSLGIYRDIPLDQPTPEATPGEEKIASIEGMTTPSQSPALPQDAPHELYETYTELDLPSYGAALKYGHDDMLPCPFKVTIDRATRKIIELRRNWKKGDETYQERNRFVKYTYIPGFGFRGLGVAHLLGQTQRATTAITRELIDAGMFASFPGWLQASAGFGQNRTNQIRVMPGRGITIETGGMPIRESVMELPYKEPSPTLFSMIGGLMDNGRKLVGSAMVPVGEGTQNMPVGTMLAMVEQATKPMAAIHKRNHTSQQHEFQLLKELFREDPEALWRFNDVPPDPNHRMLLTAALRDMKFVPASDPNTPSNVHRIARGAALYEMAKADPESFQKMEVYDELLTILRFNPQKLLKPPPPPGQGGPPQNPKIQEIQLAAQAREKEQATEMQQDIVRAGMKEAQERAKIANDQANREHDIQMQQMRMTETMTKEKGKQMSGIMGIAKANKQIEATHVKNNAPPKTAAKKKADV